MTQQIVHFADALKSAIPGFASGENTADGVVQVRMNNISIDGMLDWSSLRRVPADQPKLKKYSLQPGDVLFNSTNSPELVGKTALFSGFKEPVVFSNHFLRLRVDRRVAEPGFVAWWLNFRWQQRQFENLSTRWVNQASVRKGDLLRMRIDLPPLSEQQRMVWQLEQADRLRRTRRYALEYSGTFLAAAFIELFGDPMGNPTGFPQKRLEDFIQVDRPITYGILKPGPDIPDGVPYVRVTDIQDNLILLDTVRRTSAEIDRAYKRSRLRTGDLLMSIRGQVGRLAIVPRRLDGANITQDTARLAPVQALNVHFLMGCLASDSTQHLMRRLTKGVAVTGINLGDVRELPIPVPPLPMQQRFSSLVEGHERLQAGQREAVRQAEHLLQSLLHRTFSNDSMKRRRLMR